MKFDPSSCEILKLENEEYYVSYDLFYQVKRDLHSNWKSFNLNIEVKFNADLRIKSINEHKKL
jgi:hypothetical protein